MPVSSVDQLMAYIAQPANLATFIAAIGLATYAGTSFTRRYGQNGFQVDTVVLGTPADVELQALILDDPRIMGTEIRTDTPSNRKLFDLRYQRQVPIGWADAVFTVPAQLNAHAIPGSFQLGPGAGVQQQGIGFAPPPVTFRSKFQLSLTTDPFTLSYPLRVYLFAATDLSPTNDLRRIRQVRRFLESDPAFLKSLDGPPDQYPLLFVQLYGSTAATGTPLTAPGVAQMFDADDILAAFFSPPA
jgi:hypothetical protein